MVPIFYIKEGNLGFADKQVLSDLNLYVYPGDRICLVGKNGSGKSSLMKIISGEYEPDAGELFKAPAVNISHLKQDIIALPDVKIYDYILSDFAGDIENNRYLADIFINQLGLDGKASLKNCSGGQVRRVLLAKALVASPDILLLDEPTNHMDIIAIEWLENYLKNYHGAVICISHDRAFQQNISNKVWWIDRGILRKSSRGFRYYDEWREEVIIAEEAILRKMNRKLEAENDWLGAGVTARRKRNQKRLAGLYKLRETYQAQQLHLKQAKAKLELDLVEAEKRSKFIIEAENISYGFGVNKLFDQFNLKVKKGEKIGVIGPNGVGKSTLIKILVKEIEPLEGRVKYGTNLDITYFDQHRTVLNGKHTIRQTLCPSGGDQIFLKDRSMHVAGYLKKFMFDPRILNDRVSTLSGGESNRLLLAKSLVAPGNLLILDEPTNDLDVDSLEMLLEILADYNGTLIIISHDRDFLERLVTRTLVFDGNKIIDLYGGYEDYQKYYKNKESALADTDKKTKQAPRAINSSSAREKKLSYKYIRMLETLPAEIENIESKIADTENELSDQNLYFSNPQKFNMLGRQLQELNNQLEGKLELWMEVENMREDK